MKQHNRKLGSVGKVREGFTKKITKLREKLFFSRKQVREFSME